MRVSDQGLAFLERHEGVVLRAYRCPAGVWTIGAGLTAASGVVEPRAGMRIDAAEARRLLALALRENYEPAVLRAMTVEGAPPLQHAFDAGVSFHFNTGAIGRASWVRAWKVRDWPAVRTSIGNWRRAAGRVVSGLVRRREEEFALLQRGDYGVGAPVRVAMPDTVAPARIVAPVTAAEIPAIRAALARMGYAVGPDATVIVASAVRAFQRDHALTEDGVIGRATAAMLERVLAARRKAAAPAVLGAAAAAEAVPAGAGGLGSIEAMTGLPWAAEIAAALAIGRAIWLGWAYRDALAPLFDRSLPRLAAFLRSF